MQSTFQALHWNGARKEKNLRSETIPRIKYIWVLNTQPTVPEPDIWGQNLRVEPLCLGWATFVSFEIPSNTWNIWSRHEVGGALLYSLLLWQYWSSPEKIARILHWTFQKRVAPPVYAQPTTATSFYFAQMFITEKINKTSTRIVPHPQKLYSLISPLILFVILIPFLLLKQTEEEFNLQRTILIMSDKNERKKSLIMKTLDLLIFCCLNITIEFARLTPKSQESKGRFCQMYEWSLCIFANIRHLEIPSVYWNTTGDVN